MSTRFDRFSSGMTPKVAVEVGSCAGCGGVMYDYEVMRCPTCGEEVHKGCLTECDTCGDVGCCACLPQQPVSGLRMCEWCLETIVNNGESDESETGISPERPV